MALFSKKKEEEKKGTELTAVDMKPISNKSVKKATAKQAEPSMKDLYNGGTGVVKPAVAGKSKQEKESVVYSKYNQAYRVLQKPIITEKGGNLASMGKYVFEVAKDANKVEVAKAIQEVYGIMPVKVNLMRMEGKAKQRGNNKGKRKDWKKAIVSLPKGKTINVYEGV
jgi:large subunit ribosomal protein L23